MQKHGVFPKLYGIAGVLSYLIYCCFFTNHEHCSAYLNEHYELTEEEIKEVMDGYDPSDKDNQSNLERMMQERAFSHLTE